MQIFHQIIEFQTSNKNKKEQHSNNDKAAYDININLETETQTPQAMENDRKGSVDWDSQ